MAKIKAKQKLRLKEKRRNEKAEKEKKEEEAIEVHIGENEFDLEQRMTPPPSPPNPPNHSPMVSSPMVPSPMVPSPMVSSPPPNQTVIFDSTSIDDGSKTPTDEVPCLIQGFKMKMIFNSVGPFSKLLDEYLFLLIFEQIFSKN